MVAAATNNNTHSEIFIDKVAKTSKQSSCCRKDLLTRTSWTDAAVALAQIEKGKADGQRTTLWLRARLQAHLFALGCFLHRHAGKVLFVAILVLATFCVALKSATIQTRVEDLWIEEGGRLEKELRYTQKTLGEASGSTHELLIQTPKDPGASLLHAGALLTHLEVVKAATSVTVQLFDITWRLKDMCYSPNIPNFDVHYIDQIFENIIPCAIITPLDCFWEGSKLLGPDYPVNIPGIGSKVRWTNLNPLTLVEEMKIYDFTFPFKTLEDYLKRAGVSTGYQEKPCLDPRDPECPSTAPNKNGQVPDIGAELTGGCYGFAAKYMHWPEDLVVGGTKKNKTGHIVRAKALQTVVQLMGERELFEYWSDTYKVHHVDWTQEKAAIVLETWQNKFAEEVRKLVQKGTKTTPYSVYAFSTATLNDILKQFSELNIIKVVVGYAIMLTYVGISLLRRDDPVRSQSGIGIAGVVLVSVTVAAGLGFCALLGIAFNAATTQIIPFLALGLGVDNMFHLTHTYAETDSEGNIDEQTGVVLKKTGLSVLMTSLCIMCTFFAAALIPIPALRVFSLQAAVLVLFNLGAMLLVFPAIVSLDLRRRRSKRIDLLCCCLPSPEVEPAWPCFSARTHVKRYEYPKKLQTVTRSVNQDRQQTVTILAPPKPSDKVADPGDKNVLEFIQEEGEDETDICHTHDCLNLTLNKVIANYYAPFILKPSVKVISIMLLIIVLTGSIWGLMKVSDGLDLTDIVPQNTNEHAFLSAQSNYFGFYNMYAVTRGDFEYPNNQELLHEYHQAFIKVGNIMKNDDGGLPEFWLSMFRDWLIGLQKAFDRDWAEGCITQERWCANASDEGILAYKLLVQTGHVDNPIDKSLVRQVRLVDSKGIINPKAFYNYLSAWSWNDALAYGASQANLRPEPRQWYHIASDYELKIPKSAPLVYTQLPFYLYGLGDTEKITNLISEVRSICQKFEDKGLPNFPSGIPFVFWEQYLGLRQSLGLALISALFAVFVVVVVLLLNIWAAVLVTLSLASMVLQLLGLMGIIGIKLSAISAVLLIVAVGIGVHFTVHICLGFITCIGGKNRRTRLALEHMMAPVLHSAITTLLAVIMLAFSEFDFIVRYFFYVLLALVAVGLLNGLVFFPVLLSLIGPAAEVVGIEHPDRISTPSPEPLVQRTRSGSCRVSKVAPPRRHQCNRLHSEPSLTTITEEPGSWNSTHSIQSIVVQPELVVQTTTYNEPSPNEENANSNSSSESSTSSAAPAPVIMQNRVTTKVTATAKVKVELHTPHSKSSEKSSSTGSSSKRHGRRKDPPGDNCEKNSS
ncbi:UNVERIFIED_CONTAM: hypothetical protein PYX00_000524 [Menopon gallinae]|uniref:SSD domain-containing protein n=1 Tax=Menopon gallinae TaxID=328185 RepID=A0AAW2IBI7_9NEOP